MKKKSRRKFLADTGRLLVTISAFGPLACGCRSEKVEKDAELVGLHIEKGRLRLDLTEPRFRGLAFAGNGVRIEFGPGRKPLLIIRVSEREFAALSSECPHAGYEVLLPEQGRLFCASGHGGSFDLEGRVKSGPAQSALSRYPVEKQGSLLFISYPA